MSRSVELLYFAAVRDVTGRAREQCTLPESVGTVGDLAFYLEQMRPELAGRLTSVRFAVNESFVAAEHPLADGDVVALIPPVSGG